MNGKTPFDFGFDCRVRIELCHFTVFFRFDKPKKKIISHRGTGCNEARHCRAEAEFDWYSVGHVLSFPLDFRVAYRIDRGKFTGLGFSTTKNSFSAHILKGFLSGEAVNKYYVRINWKRYAVVTEHALD